MPYLLEMLRQNVWVKRVDRIHCDRFLWPYSICEFANVVALDDAIGNFIEGPASNLCADAPDQLRKQGIQAGIDKTEPEPKGQAKF